MMLQPKKNFGKRQKEVYRSRGNAKRGLKVCFGVYGMKAKTRAFITARQIESARRTMTRHIKRGGKIWIRIFPDKPRTKKPLEVRQGKGKGSIEDWVAVVKPGCILFEMEGVSKDIAREAFRLAAAKLPIDVCFVEETVM